MASCSAIRLATGGQLLGGAFQQCHRGTLHQLDLLAISNSSAFWPVHLWLNKSLVCKRPKCSVYRRGSGVELPSCHSAERNGEPCHPVQGFSKRSQRNRLGGFKVQALKDDGGVGDSPEPAGASKKEKDQRSLVLYGKIEKVFEETARRSQGTDGSGGDWEEVEVRSPVDSLG